MSPLCDVDSLSLSSVSQPTIFVDCRSEKQGRPEIPAMDIAMFVRYQFHNELETSPDPLDVVCFGTNETALKHLAANLAK